MGWSYYCIIFLLYTVTLNTAPFYEYIIASLVFLSVGILQYHLLHAAHEASHQDFRTRSKTANLVACFVAYPIGLTKSFRDEHLQHHKHFGVPNLDPDLPIYKSPPKSKIDFLIFIIFSFSGLAAINQIFWGNKSSTLKSSRSSDTISLIFVQIIIMIIFSLSMGPMYYLFFWLLPLITLVQGLAKLRGLAEHGDPVIGKFVLRTFLDNGLLACFFGNMGFRHHAEHHFYPMVPFENLQIVRERMLAHKPHTKGNLSIEICTGNHLTYLNDWFHNLPWQVKD